MCCEPQCKLYPAAFYVVLNSCVICVTLLHPLCVEWCMVVFVVRPSQSWTVLPGCWLLSSNGNKCLALSHFSCCSRDDLLFQHQNCYLWIIYCWAVNCTIMNLWRESLSICMLFAVPYFIQLWEWFFLCVLFQKTLLFLSNRRIGSIKPNFSFNLKHVHIYHLTLCLWIDSFDECEGKSVQVTLWLSSSPSWWEIIDVISFSHMQRHMVRVVVLEPYSRWQSLMKHYLSTKE